MLSTVGLAKLINSNFTVYIVLAQKGHVHVYILINMYSGTNITLTGVCIACRFVSHMCNKYKGCVDGTLTRLLQGRYNIATTTLCVL